MGHTDWRHAEIQLSTCFAASRAEEERNRLEQMMGEGRLPISSHRITPVECSGSADLENAVARRSAADLVIFGFIDAQASSDLAGAVSLYLLFVNASERIPNCRVAVRAA